jgi:hypothetical protein
MKEQCLVCVADRLVIAMEEQCLVCVAWTEFMSFTLNSFFKELSCNTETLFFSQLYRAS